MATVKIEGLPHAVTIDGVDFSKLSVGSIQKTVTNLAPQVYRPIEGWAVRGRGPNPWTLTVEKGTTGERRVVYDAQSMYSKANFGHGNSDLYGPVNEYVKTAYGAAAGGIDNDVHAAALQAIQALVGFPARIQFKSGGGEAVDAACNKLVMKVWHDLYGRPGKIVVANRCFHGRPSGVTAYLDATSQKGFACLSNSVHVPFNDLEALRNVLLKNHGTIAAVLLEPIQGEGGVFVPDGRYLAGVRALCTEYGVLLVLDEIQTGFGRTGENFAFEHYNIIPDVLILGKAFGGIATASAIVAHKKARLPIGGAYKEIDLYAHMEEGTDGQTHSRDARISMAVLAAIKTLCDHDLAKKSSYKGEYAISLLKALKEKRPGIITDVRGIGLMIAVEGNFDGRDLSYALLERGVWAYPSRKNIMRILPPLTIPLPEITDLVDIFGKALSDVA